MPERLPHAMRLYLITDDRGRRPQVLEEIVEQAIAGGVTAVQFREKCSAPSTCTRAFARLSKLCRDRKVPLLLNADMLGRFDVQSEYDGVHYSERTLPLHADAAGHLSGYSAHTVEEGLLAVTRGVRFLALSPIFDTPSKKGILESTGLPFLSETRKNLPKHTLLALGGITAENAGQCVQAGADGVAVIRAIMESSDPCAAAGKLRAAMDEEPA